MNRYSSEVVSESQYLAERRCGDFNGDFGGDLGGDFGEDFSRIFVDTPCIYY